MSKPQSFVDLAKAMQDWCNSEALRMATECGLSEAEIAEVIQPDKPSPLIGLAACLDAVAQRKQER